MRIAIAGDWRYDIYEAACAEALVALGHEVVRIRLREEPSSMVARTFERCGHRDPRTQPATALVSQALRRAPVDAVLIWRGVTVSARDIEYIRQASSAPVVSYNNDDPFAGQRGLISTMRHRLLWRTFRSAIPAYDLNLVYRHCNLHDYTAAGSRRTALWRSAFIPALHRPGDLTTPRHGIVFAGHAEDDLRLECLQRLAVAGLPCAVHGDGSWTAARRARILPLEVKPAERGPAYAAILQSAVAGLCFLSRLNRDTYTRRCFEIPACGAVLLAERTDDLRQLFREDEEAVFFSGSDELLAKAGRLLADPARAERIALAGLRRVRTDGHDLPGRARELVAMIGTLR
jgi:spore maturation protein CgeB